MCIIFVHHRLSVCKHFWATPMYTAVYILQHSPTQCHCCIANLLTVCLFTHYTPLVAGSLHKETCSVIHAIIHWRTHLGLSSCQLSQMKSCQRMNVCLGPSVYLGAKLWYSWIRPSKWIPIYSYIPVSDNMVSDLVFVCIYEPKQCLLSELCLLVLPGEQDQCLNFHNRRKRNNSPWSTRLSALKWFSISGNQAQPTRTSNEEEEKIK